MAIATALNIVFVVVEALFSFLTGSLALLANAGYNLSDGLGLLLAWGASFLALLKNNDSGDRFTNSPMPTMTAIEVKKDNNTLTLRDDDGFPMWRASLRQESKSD